MTRALGMILALPLTLAAQQKEVDALLAADREYSASSAKTDLISGLTAMFSERVIMPTAARDFAHGIAKATEALRANAANAQSKAEWTPIRAGISADGQHGFTYGYITTRRGDGTEVPGKYLAYWAREGGVWKVLAYKRSGRPAGEVSLALLPASLPTRLVDPKSDSSLISGLAASLAAAEKSFSDEAAVIGIGPAFEKYGRADAMNIGREAAFTLGNVEIGKAIGGPAPGEPSPVAWDARHAVIVATSGDLGVTFGFIRQKADPSAPGQPFFTIWRRDSPTAPWRYIAE